MRDYSRFDCFLSDREGDVYPQVPPEPHLSIAQSTIEGLHRDGLIGSDQRMLDVGYGQGIALDIFRRLGLQAAPDTSAHHERNPNYYSVLPASAWFSLFSRIGFGDRSLAINFNLPCEPDTHWSYLLRRNG